MGNRKQPENKGIVKIVNKNPKKKASFIGVDDDGGNLTRWQPQEAKI